MHDSGLFLLLAGALVVFAAISFYIGPLTTHLSRKSKSRPPHRVLVRVTQIWFAVLAMGCLLLLILPLFARR